MYTTIRINDGPDIDWDAICYWVVNQFGTPGLEQRVMFHTHSEWMDFLFVNEQDAIMFTLKWVGNERKTKTLR
jgi:hypothetical protein